MITRINKLACLGALCFGMNAMADFKGVWMAGGSENKVITNYDVNIYTKNYIISDKVKMSLFKKSNGNFEVYQGKLDELADKLYEETLNRMIYQRYIETYAGFSQKSGERKYFKTTSREYKEKVEIEIKKHLEKFNREPNPRAAFGEFLQEQGYPHHSGESLLQTYSKWEEDLRYKVKEDFRVKNVNIAEYGIALEDYPDRYRNPDKDIMAVSNYQDKHRKAWSKFAGKTMARNDYERQARGLDPMVVDAKVYGLESSIGDLKKSKGFLEDSAKFISTSFTQKSFASPVSKVGEYIELAKELAQSKDKAELEDARQNELKKFMGGTTRSPLVMARLYDLALELTERQAKNLDKKKEEVLAHLTNPSKLIQILKSADDSVHIADALGNALMNTSSAEELLLAEIVKNSLEEIAKHSQVRIEVNLKKSLSMDEYDQVKAKVKNEFYANVLTHFRKNNINRYAHFLKRSLDGRHHEQGEEVLLKVLP